MKHIIHFFLLFLPFSTFAQTDKIRVNSDNPKVYQELDEVTVNSKRMDTYELLSMWIKNNLNYSIDKDTMIPYAISYVVLVEDSKDTLAIADGTFVIDHKGDTKIINRNLLNNASVFTALKYKELDHNTNYQTNYLKESGIGLLMYNNFLSGDYQSNIKGLRRYNDRILKLKKAETNQFIFEYYGLDENDKGKVKFYFNDNNLLDSFESENLHTQYIFQKEDFLRIKHSKTLFRYDVESRLLYPSYIDYTMVYSAVDKATHYRVSVVAQRMEAADLNMLNSDLYKKRISILQPIKMVHEMSFRKSFYK